MKQRIYTVLLLVSVLLFSCGGGDKAAAGSAPPDGVLKLTIDRPIFTRTPQGTATEEAWFEESEKYLGLTLDITWRESSWGDYNDKLSTFLAGGEYGDIFHISGHDDQVTDMGAGGLILNLLDYPEVTKNYMALVNQSPQKKNIYSSDGGVYGFHPTSAAKYYAMTPGIAINKTEFDNNGWSIPSSLAELYQVALQIKAKYPDSYPIIDFDWGGSILSSVILDINHVGNGIYYDGSQYVFGPRLAEYQEAIAFSQKLYAEGLYDPEAGTVKGANDIERRLLKRQNFIALKVWAGGIQTVLNKSEVSNDKFAWIPPLKGLQDQLPWVGGWDPGTAISSGYILAINGDTEYPELVVKFADFSYSPRMIDIRNWGIEGDTFTYDSNGNPQFTEKVLSDLPDPKAGIMTDYGMSSSGGVRSALNLGPMDRDAEVGAPPLDVYLKEGWTIMNWMLYGDRIIGDGYGVFSPRQSVNLPIVKLTVAERKEERKIMTPVDTFVSEEVTKFITGKRAMSEWDAFQGEILEYGDYQKIVELYNAKL